MAPAQSPPSSPTSSPTVSPDPTGQPLVLTVTCSTDPRRVGHRTHPIVLHADWSVDTGHDLEAERFTVAFGGFLSCLDLVDRVLPAVRSYVGRQLRADLPELSLGVGYRWTSASRVETCCAGSTSFATAAAASAHVRGARHVAAEHGARTTQVSSLGRRVLAAHGVRDPVPLPRDAVRLVGQQVPTLRDVLALWDAGISPDVVEQVHGVAGHGRPLPPAFYLGVLSRRPDLKWIAETAASAPEREVHTWLAWSETDRDRAEPTLRGEFLRLGVSHSDLTALSTSAYRPADVALLARELRMTPTAAARALAQLASADCFPAVPDLVAVARRADVGLSAVTGPAVERLVFSLAALGIRGTREEHAFALMLCGAPAVTARVVSAVGSLDTRAIENGLQDWEHHRQGGRRASA